MVGMQGPRRVQRRVVSEGEEDVKEGQRSGASRITDWRREDGRFG
jgi:hypothetical protein